MKTTLIIFAALLFSLASIAQTEIRNTDAVKDATSVTANKSGSNLSNSGSASSSTMVQSNAVPAAEHKVTAKSQQTKEAVAAEKKETITKAKGEEQQAKTAVPKNASVGVQSSSATTANGTSNKTSEKASINQQTSAPSVNAKPAVSRVRSETKTAVAHTKKPGSAPIKANAKVKVNTSMRIR